MRVRNFRRFSFWANSTTEKSHLVLNSVAFGFADYIYVTENAPTVLRPKKELKGFRKVTLAPGKSAVVEFELDRQALAFWDTQSRGWKVNPGEYTLSLGTSSADIAATLPVSVK